MTPQEAYRELLSIRKYIEDGYVTHLSYGGNADEQTEKNIETYSVAISALEKQIPKKPYKTKEPISQKQNDYYCSVCKRYLGDDMELKHACLQPEYCQHCGQALDWSDAE